MCKTQEIKHPLLSKGNNHRWLSALPLTSLYAPPSLLLRTMTHAACTATSAVHRGHRTTADVDSPVAGRA
jgi:hypothetical protein